MALSDITAEAVIAACREFDEAGKTSFLAKYGFRASRSYELHHNGKYYDSKAVLGAAHGYLGPEYPALRPQHFSGGLQVTVRVLENLGFEVVESPPPTRNPDWTRNELILATEFYRQYAPRIPGKTTRRLIDFADEIRAAATLQGLRGNDTFRNPNGVYMKLMELRKYDNTYSGIGLGHERPRDIELEVWRLDETELFIAARDIRTRIRNFLGEGGQIPTIERPMPKSAVLRDLIESDDSVENQLAEVLMDWQDFKRQSGRTAGLGREPGQIKDSGAVYVIEQRVRNRSSGFDEVSATDQSYEKIVVDHPDRFSEAVVQIAKGRISDFELAKPTDDHTELERKTTQILSRPDLISAPPAGNPSPRRGLAKVVAFFRNPLVVAYTQARANGKCELCRTFAPFKKPDGTPYLETHHIVPLAEGGPDTTENCAAVCPNCHRALHYAENRQELARKLKSQKR